MGQHALGPQRQLWTCQHLESADRGRPPDVYRWKAKGQGALQAAFSAAAQEADQQCPLERAILTLLVEGHASYRGIQQCLWTLLGQHVSLGTIASVVQQAGERAQQWLRTHAPSSGRALALDELYGREHGRAYLNVVDVHSGALWASTSPVEVDAESWILVLWQVEEPTNCATSC